MKALIVEISFFEAFFKVHYTKGFRLTYPIPLPTTVAGIFGAMLGVERKVARKKFNEFLFGAAIVDGKNYSECVENYTYIQQGKDIKGVTNLHILHEPSFYIVIAHKDEKELSDIRRSIQSPKYLPFGGQNDFFPKDWKIYSIVEVKKSNIISNYLPQKWVNKIKENTIFEILPVMHKFNENENFIFIINGDVESKNTLPVCEIEKKKIGLYSLANFYLVGEWRNEVG